MDDYSDILYRVEERIARITLNAPEKRIEVRTLLHTSSFSFLSPFSISDSRYFKCLRSTSLSFSSVFAQIGASAA